MDVGAVERLLRSLAFEGLGGLEFRVPAEVARWFFATHRISLQKSGSAAIEKPTDTVDVFPLASPSHTHGTVTPKTLVAWGGVQGWALFR